MKLRPKYTKHIDSDIRKVKDLLVCELDNTEGQLKCEVYDSHILVKYRPELHKLWTPQINITLREEEEGTKIRGSIGPSGEIWLAFVFFYSLFALVFVGAFLFALTQISLGHSSTLFLSISGLGLISLITMYLISYFGQYKSKKQIEYLYSWIEKSLNKDTK